MDQQERTTYLRSVVSDGTPLILSGQILDRQLLNEVFSRMSVTTEGGQSFRCIPTDAYFEDCTFDVLEIYEASDGQRGLSIFGTCSFQGSFFRHGLLWRNLACKKDVVFSTARFEGDACFNSAEIGQTLQLDGCDVAGELDLRGASIGNGLALNYVECGGVDLREAKVESEASFTGSNFAIAEDVQRLRSLSALFSGAVFGMNAYFDGVTFPPRVVFAPDYMLEPATISASVYMSSCTFGSVLAEGSYDFRGLTLPSIQFWSNKIYGNLDFTQSTFSSGSALRYLKIYGSSSEVDYQSLRPYEDTCGLVLDGASFHGGLRLADVSTEGVVVLDKATISGDFSMTAVSAGQAIIIRDCSMPYSPIDGTSAALEIRRCHFQKGGLLTLECAAISIVETTSDARIRIARRGQGDGEVAALTDLSNTDAENFTLQNLDVSRANFASVANLDKLELQGNVRFSKPMTRWTTGRRVIRDELDVRIDVAEGRVDKSRAGDVATTYRALRKAREDKKDEPGGADFYYGEMEMRRLAAPRGSVEHVLLTTYWLVSGYGLRATRTLFPILSVLALGGLALRMQSGQVAGGYLQNVISLALISVGLDRIPPNVTTLSAVVFIFARLALPASLALAALAIRGRVKR